MCGEDVAVSQRVLDEMPERTAAFRGGPRPGGLPFDALLRRAGIRYQDIL